MAGSCTQITRELYDSRPLNGRAVADALLANVEPMAAATVGPNRERLEEERASLRAGIGDLQDRLRELFDEIKAIQGEAFQPIAEHAQRLANAYLADARRAAEQIVEAYAAANAILRTTRFGMDEEGRLKRAFAGVTAEGALLPWRRALPVPAELVDVLAKLQGKGSALPVSVASSVAAP